MRRLLELADLKMDAKMGVVTGVPDQPGPRDSLDCCRVGTATGSHVLLDLWEVHTQDDTEEH